MENRLNSFSYSLPENLEKAVLKEIANWKNENKTARLWAKDASLWTSTDEANWLGWLEIIEEELRDQEKYQTFAADVKAFNHIVLLGMGGSSLCPEVISRIFSVKNFHVLDSTVPAQVKSIEDKVNLAETLFIVASKSGSTLEPNCFKQYFYTRMAETVGEENAGKHFVAITDPNSKMQAIAERDNFRQILFGKPQIGGRFSALSVFGMTAASSMQIDVKEFLGRAELMSKACKNENPEENPGVLLGIILGAAHALGKDKLMIVTSPEEQIFGAWLEQLIAESVGKEGISIIPIDCRGVAPQVDSDSAVYVYCKNEKNFDAQQDKNIDEIEKSGRPLIRLNFSEKMNLGQEFFRWEIATAVAGSLMKINPFNQPDVESAKVEARKIMDEYELVGSLPAETPFFEENGVKLYSDEKNSAELNQAVGENKSLVNYLQKHFSRCEKNDYLAILGYVEMNPKNLEILEKIRQKLSEKYQVAVSVQFGPRFLHSTGQAFKGGANNGVFLQISTDDVEDFPVPEQKYTFGIVKEAQSRGDFQVLVDRNRRALRLHLQKESENALENIFAEI